VPNPCKGEGEIPTNQVPNLDDQPREDLLAFHERYKEADSDLSIRLVGDRPQHLKWTYTLANYAKKKADAIKARTDGYITDAVRLERECDEAWLTLPEDLRW
jgi:hypothetical protein